MSADSRVRYVIDAQDRISFVDDGWYQFAEANEGTEMMRPAVLGRSLWDYITDATTCKLYQQLVSRVRQGQHARFTIRCDGPECRRLLEMTISAAADGSVEFETRAVRVEDRAPVMLLSRAVPRSQDLLRVCGWCNRMDAGSGSEEWVEVELAVERLQLFELGRLPELTHGMCEACLVAMTRTLDDMDSDLAAAESAPPSA